MVEFLNGSDNVRLAFLYCLCDVGHIALHLLVVVGLYCVKKTLWWCKKCAFTCSYDILQKTKTIKT